MRGSLLFGGISRKHRVIKRSMQMFKGQTWSFRLEILCSFVLLTWKGLQRVPRLGKLAPRYVRPFMINAHIGQVAYKIKLSLPACWFSTRLPYVDVEEGCRLGAWDSRLRDLEIFNDLSIEERPVRIIDQQKQILQGMVIPLVKVLWTHRGDKE